MEVGFGDDTNFNGGMWDKNGTARPRYTPFPRQEKGQDRCRRDHIVLMFVTLFRCPLIAAMLNPINT